MKKTLLVINVVLASIAVYGCSPEVKTPADFPDLLKRTPGFEDCKIAQLQNSRGTTLYVVRCPNSNTGVTRAGKNPGYLEVIEGNPQ